MAERSCVFITTGDKAIKIKCYINFKLCSILVSASDYHSADLGSNPSGGENSTKGFSIVRV